MPRGVRALFTPARVAIARRATRFVPALIAASLLGSLAVVVSSVAPAAASVGDDTVRAYGYVSYYGSTSSMALNSPLIDIIGTDGGYWLLGEDGGVFSFGSARFYGSTGGIRLNAPIVGGAAVPGGRGYWLFAGDGGVFSFGSARFYGSTGGTVLNRPIVDMIPTPDGRGYWLIASDGGVFSFGSARFYGSTGSIHLVQPIVAAVSARYGLGYMLVAADGGVFAFGKARFFGSGAGILRDYPIVDVARTPNGDGYWLAAENGTVLEFGNAKHFGDGAGEIGYERRVVAITSPWRNGYLLATTPRPGVLPQLGPGDSGAAVVALQNQLTGLGYWLGSPDGAYGLLTEQAVTAFQKVQGLERTGRIDLPTQRALVSATRPTARGVGNHVEVDKARQVVFIVRNGRVDWTLNTSTGTEAPYVFEGTTYIAHTPTGTFHIIRVIDGVREGRLGTLYRPRYFTNDGVAFHGSTSVPPYGASHGCVRLTNPAIDWVWATNAMPIGSTVEVY